MGKKKTTGKLKLHRETVKQLPRVKNLLDDDLAKANGGCGYGTAACNGGTSGGPWQSVAL